MIASRLAKGGQAMRTLLCGTIVCLLTVAVHGAGIGKVTVTAEQAPIMQGNETILTAKKGDTFDVSEAKGDWYGVLPSRGWIHKASVRYEPSAPAVAPADKAGPAVAAETGATPGQPKPDPETSALMVLGQCTYANVTVPPGMHTFSVDALARLTARKAAELLLSKPLAAGFAEVARAGKSKDDEIYLEAFGSLEPSIEEIVKIFGKEKATSKAYLEEASGGKSVALHDENPQGKYRELTWYKYGWLHFGVVGGKVRAVCAECSKAPLTASKQEEPGAIAPEVQKAAASCFAEGKEFYLYDLKPNPIVLGGTLGTYPCTVKFIRSGKQSVPLDQLGITAGFITAVGGSAGVLASRPQVAGDKQGTITFEVRGDLWLAGGMIHTGVPAQLQLFYRDTKTGKATNCSNEIQISLKP